MSDVKSDRIRLVNVKIKLRVPSESWHMTLNKMLIVTISAIVLKIQSGEILEYF